MCDQTHAAKPVRYTNHYIYNACVKTFHLQTIKTVLTQDNGYNCSAERPVCFIFMSTDVHIHAPQMVICGRLDELGLQRFLQTDVGRTGVVYLCVRRVKEIKCGHESGRPTHSHRVTGRVVISPHCHRVTTKVCDFTALPQGHGQSL